MTSSNESTSAFLGNLMSRYDGISTYSLSPELSMLVSSNVAPTTFQATELKASIDNLDGPITKLQNELKDIRHDCHVALSPIHHLPAEVLVEILCWTPKSNIELCNTLNNYQSFFVHGFNVFKISKGSWYLGQISCLLNPEDIRIPAPGKGMIALLN
ncbi:hypothetical protein EDD18DRAFT_1365417 [Armillaria luteobubalina]|uniref:F-box domain-containing protein n=1 Tax=Armillaria luteobubalina TaxID=153913 RepID=A0AA39P4M4_9AGAR|nr:hypothetical protein EDD18DRAFT_1365417 [Armillaria luteobubalina]